MCPAYFRFVQASQGLGCLLATIVLTQPSLAQLVPDSSLGAQPSTVSTHNSTDTIGGGVRSGSNLFHSFLEFNVGTGRSVFFADPGVTNILTRVTGPNLSRIDGVLGVSGPANLFLLNPNGIQFGPNAQLQITGSFLATTADRFRFGNGSEFSASNPQAPPLLTVNVPLGLQLGASRPGATIVNRGHLITGQNLTLVGDRLELQGTLQAGQNLSLQAQDTLQVRDSQSVPFQAIAGGDLQLRGDQAIDILALNHLHQTPFVSGGNLTLISDGIISGDAHFASAGDVTWLTTTQAPGTFVSLYDPIVRASGNVRFGNYTGAALKVEAGGSIQGGNIRITGPDLGIPLSDPDSALLRSSPSVILRAGLPVVGLPNVPQATGGTTFNSVPGAPGQNITVGTINTSRTDANAGAIVLEARNGAIQTGDLNTSSSTTLGIRGNAGNVTLVAARAIQTGNIQASSTNSGFSFSGQSGNGGVLTLTANEAISTGNLAIGSFSYGSAGNGGAANLSSRAGTITVGDVDGTTYGVSNVGNASRVTIASGNGNLSTGNLQLDLVSNSNTVGRSAAAVTLATGNGNITTGTVVASSVAMGNAGDGGTINLFSAQGDINTRDLKVGSGGSSRGRNGGTITVVAQNGNLALENLNADSFGYYGNDNGNGGVISLSSPNGTLTTRNLNVGSVSNYYNTGNAGRVSLAAAGELRTEAISAYALATAYGLRPPLAPGFLPQTGRGGEITLDSTRGSIQTGNVFSFSTTSPDPNFFFGRPEEINSATQMLRASGHAGGGNIQLSAAQNLTTGLMSSISSGGSGNITLTAGNTFTSNGTVISSDTFGNGPAGNIQVSARSVQLRNGAQLSASTHAAGRGGNIQVVAGVLELSGTASQVPTTDLRIATPIGLTVLPQVYLGGYVPTGDIETIATQSSGAFPTGIFVQNTQTSTGAAGTIDLQVGRLNLHDRGTIAATTFSSGQGGNLSIRATDIVVDNGSIFSGVAPGASGNSGTIELQTRSLTVTHGSQIQAKTLGLGHAGDIRVQAEAITVTGDHSGIISGSGTPDQRTPNTGAGGNLFLRTGTLQVSNDGILSTSTFTNGRGGNIQVTADQISLTDRGRLSATTQGQGDAGSIAIVAHDRVSITGAGSGLFANTTPQSSGNGGSVFLTTDQLQIGDRGRITVDSQGSGQGGDIQLATTRIQMSDGAAFVAETASTQGGNITIQASDLLLMRRNSMISTSAGRSQAGGNGGNITISAGFVIGVLSENSDISANAFTGDGGQVNITSQGIYGLKFQTRLTPRSDITASSQFGLNGTVTLTTLNIDPSRGLAALPSNLTDPSDRIAQTCASHQRSNRFVVTGRGGLSPDPTEALNQTSLWTGSPTPPANLTPTIGSVSAASSHRPIAEASRWIKQPDGAIVLMSENEIPWTTTIAHCQSQLQETR